VIEAGVYVSFHMTLQRRFLNVAAVRVVTVHRRLHAVCVTGPLCYGLLFQRFCNTNSVQSAVHSNNTNNVKCNVAA
jgi:hypothetical protein